jgi:uncharacterized membrane protein YcjF (UPF0283 family)
MSSTRGIMKKITPECENMAKRSTMLNTVGVFFAIVAVILIIVALVYNYMPTDDEVIRAKNIKTVGTMNIIALFAVVITSLVGIWQIMVNNKLKQCINTAPTTT